MKKILIFIILFTFPLSLTVSAEGWGFQKNTTHTLPNIGRYAEIISGTNSYYHGDTSKKEVYLTFDVGYDNGNLSEILDILDDNNVRATFFVTGDFVKRFPSLAIRLAYSNHLIGSHSFYHRPITSLSKDDLKKDLDLLQEEYYKLTTKNLSYYFRPPAGVFDHQSLLNVANLGYKSIFWSAAWKDWLTSSQESVDSYRSYFDQLHNGAFVLIHTVSSSNKNALDKIIKDTINLGYAFKTVDEVE